MSTTDQKLDELKELFTSSISFLKKSHEESFKVMGDKLNKLEEDLAVAKAQQEDATEQALKRARKERPLEFNRKGHEEQFLFNQQVQGNIASASRQLGKLEATDRDKAVLEKARDELMEGAAALTDRQKMICLADSSENGWGAVKEYKGLYEFADNEEDNTKMVNSDRSAGVRKRRIAANQRGLKRPRRFNPAWAGQYQQPIPPAPTVVPTAPLMQHQARPRGIPGPCFQCGEMGHLRASCPKRQRPYPFNTNKYVWHAGAGDIDSSSLGCDNTVVQNNAGYGVPSPDRDANPAALYDKNMYGGESPVSTTSHEKTKGHVVAGVNVSSKVKSNQQGEALERGDLTMGFGQKGVNEPYRQSCSSEQGTNADFALEVTKGSLTPKAKSEDSQEPLDQMELGRCWEIEGGEQIEEVRGRLKANIDFWQHTLKPAPWVLDCIIDGYKLPLRVVPDCFTKKNQESALKNSNFVAEALRELETNRCIERVDDQPHICSPLSVVENGKGKSRLVINLRYLNQFLWKDKFKYEDIRIAMLMFQKNDFMFSFDLKSGYHHVEIYKPHRRYLGFQWIHEGRAQFFVFTVLPFGLATACYAFTKLLRPLVKYWRSQGLRVILYLDDGVLAVSGKQAALEASGKVRQDLRKAGLVENISKSNWHPSQRLTWLGFDLDLEVGQIAIPQEKIIALRSLVQSTLEFKQIKAKLLASILGKIISMALGLGPVSRLMTRSLYALLNTRHFWCESLAISLEAREELLFWVDNLNNLNGQGIWHSPSALRVVYSDASDTGYGGYTVEHGYHMAQGL